MTPLSSKTKVTATGSTKPWLKFPLKFLWVSLAPGIVATCVLVLWDPADQLIDPFAQILTVIAADQLTSWISIIELKSNSGRLIDPSNELCLARTLRGEGLFKKSYFRLLDWVHKQTSPKPAASRNSILKVTRPSSMIRERHCACLSGLHVLAAGTVRLRRRTQYKYILSFRAQI